MQRSEITDSLVAELIHELPRDPHVVANVLRSDTYARTILPFLAALLNAWEDNVVRALREVEPSFPTTDPTREATSRLDDMSPAGMVTLGSLLLELGARFTKVGLIREAQHRGLSADEYVAACSAEPLRNLTRTLTKPGDVPESLLAQESVMACFGEPLRHVLSLATIAQSTREAADDIDK